MSSKKKKKTTKLINNQLECFFLFPSSSKTKYNNNFPTPKPKDPKPIMSITQLTTSDLNIKTTSHHCHSIKKASHLSWL